MTILTTRPRSRRSPAAAVHPAVVHPLPGKRMLPERGAAAALVRQLLRYAVVGGLGTVVTALLYLVFRTWWDALPANLAALAVSTVVTTEANRRFTFGGAPADRIREYVQNAGSVAFYAVYSSLVLVLLGQLVADPTAVAESVTVALASVLGGVARFVVLRNWVFTKAHATA